MDIITVGSAEERAAVLKLYEHGLRRDWTVFWRPLIVLIAIATALIVAVTGDDNGEEVAATIAGGVLLVGYVEWFLTRRETSMDKFFDRLVTTNNYRREIKEEGPYSYNPIDLYVFSEIDNLEYVIERYRFGYMSPVLALRGVNTFKSRLKLGDFKARVARLAGPQCGYSEHMCRMVRHISGSP